MANGTIKSDNIYVIYDSNTGYDDNFKNISIYENLLYLDEMVAIKKASEINKIDKTRSFSVVTLSNFIEELEDNAVNEGINKGMFE